MNEKPTPLAANQIPHPTNPFKELPELEATAPERLKERVIGSYGLFIGVFKIIDLYLGNFFGAITGLLTLNQSAPPPQEPSTEERVKPPQDK